MITQVMPARFNPHHVANTSSIKRVMRYQQGLALVVVLYLVTLLSVFVTSVFWLSYQELILVRNSVRNAQVTQVSEMGATWAQTAFHTATPEATCQQQFDLTGDGHIDLSQTRPYQQRIQLSDNTVIGLMLQIDIAKKTVLITSSYQPSSPPAPPRAIHERRLVLPECTQP